MLKLRCDTQPAAAAPETGSMRRVLRILVFCAGLFGCGVPIPLPTLSLHALSQLTRSRRDAEHRRARDFLLALQLTFETQASAARRSRTPLERELLSIGWDPLPGACEDSALCEWARFAEESTLSVLGVSP